MGRKTYRRLNGKKRSNPGMPGVARLYISPSTLFSSPSGVRSSWNFSPSHGVKALPEAPSSCENVATEAALPFAVSKIDVKKGNDTTTGSAKEDTSLVAQCKKGSFPVTFQQPPYSPEPLNLSSQSISAATIASSTHSLTLNSRNPSSSVPRLVDSSLSSVDSGSAAVTTTGVDGTDAYLELTHVKAVPVNAESITTESMPPYSAFNFGGK